MIKLVTPTLKDMWFRQKMLADAETMSYNHAWGGTIDFPKERWADWYDFWIIDAGNARFYAYLWDDAANKFVGEIAYHYDSEQKIHIANVIVLYEFRGNGYGKAGLGLLIDAARNNGIKELYDNIAIDNPAIKLFLDCGFKEEYRNDEIIMLKKVL